MKYILSHVGDTVYLETIDGNTSTTRLINRNKVEVIARAPVSADRVASGDGEWNNGDGFTEFRAKAWKVRCFDDGSLYARTGDGDAVPYLFSGVEKHHTGETAAARLLAFFGAEK